MSLIYFSNNGFKSPIKRNKLTGWILKQGSRHFAAYKKHNSVTKTNTT